MKPEEIKSATAVQTILEEIENFLDSSVSYTEASVDKKTIENAVIEINRGATDGLKLDTKVVLSFAAGINGFMGPATKFFKGEYGGFSDQELLFLAIALVGSFQKTDMKKFKVLLLRLLKGKGKLRKIVLNAREVFVALMKRLNTVGSMGAFTVLLVPIMGALSNITGGTASAVNATMIKNILLGMGINYSFYALGSGIKNVFSRLQKRLTNKV
jgi:hypothetical protein